MPPKGSKAKARAEARKEKKAQADSAANTETQATDVSAAAAAADDSQEANTSTTDDDDEDGTETDGFEDAEGGDDSTAAEAASTEPGHQATATPQDSIQAAADDKQEQEPIPSEDQKSAVEKESPADRDGEKEQSTINAHHDISPTSTTDQVGTPATTVSHPTTTTDNTIDSSASEDMSGKQSTLGSSSVAPASSDSTPQLVAKDLPDSQTQIATSQEAPPPPVPLQAPPPAPPRPAAQGMAKAATVDSTTTKAPTVDTTDTRKRSQSSLWDRLRSPGERAAAAAANIPETPTSAPGTAATANTPSTAASRRPSSKPASSGIFNSLTSAANFAATSAASRGFTLPERLGGGPAVAASLAPAPTERKRLPRHEIDESKMMEDQMRFAEARHLLSTSKDSEVIRGLGKDLEMGWREKLAEVTELHVKLEDLAASVSDVQDENEQLRVQLASLSEQIALREEDFEGFQRLTVAHQARERELWQQEGSEERERLEWKEREAVRILAEERAINAQLRLVLLGSLKEQSQNGNGPTGLTGQSRLSLLDATGFDPSATPQRDSRRNTTTSSALFDNLSDSGASSPTQELSRSNAGPGAGNEAGGAAAAGEDRIQDDVLFNLNLPHAANNNGTSSGSASLSAGTAASNRPISSLVTDVVPLDQLRLLLRLDGSATEQELSSVLPHAGGGGGGGNSSGSSGSGPQSNAAGLEEAWSPRTATNSAQAMGAHSPTASLDARSGSAEQATSGGEANGSRSSRSSSSMMMMMTTMGGAPLPKLESHLLSAKSVADFQLSQSLQLENLSLRSRLKDEQKSNTKLQQEVKMLKEKIQGMEEAVSGLLEQTGGAGAAVSPFVGQNARS